MTDQTEAKWGFCCDDELDRVEDAQDPGSKEIIKGFTCGNCKVHWKLVDDGHGNEIFQGVG